MCILFHPNLINLRVWVRCQKFGHHNPVKGGKNREVRGYRFLHLYINLANCAESVSCGFCKIGIKTNQMRRVHFCINNALVLLKITFSLMERDQLYGQQNCI